MEMNTIQNIPNASTVRLRILLMKTGEELLLTPEELPPTYKSPQRLVTRIMKGYDCAYVVLRTLEMGTYKIICRKEASEILNGTRQVRSGKKSDFQLKPEHSFSLADLAQLADVKLNFAERDEADMSPQGITSTYIASVRAMVVNLKNAEDDISFLMWIGMAKDAKNETRAALYNNLSNLRRMAKNGLNDITYSTFKFEGLKTMNDAEFAMKARLLHKKAGKPEINSLLLPFGCTTVFLDEIQTQLTTFLNHIDTVDEKESDRILGTYNRTLIGNQVYKAISKICGTGKSVYQYVNPDPARWEDYVMGGEN